MTTYEEVAQSAGLDPIKRRRFLQYMRGRSWRKEESMQCATGYAREWAERFLRGIEYQMSDLEGQALLDAMDDEDRREAHCDIAAAKAYEDANETS